MYYYIYINMIKSYIIYISNIFLFISYKEKL
uniref:Uncharacterized protein n=1 Tax=viral metagenome TaxID=1070528 RepID=A0A6C0I9M1_9ZZZZ